jgi:ABC-type transport system involved in cytochrome c biogenesis ATPase subunit
MFIRFNVDKFSILDYTSFFNINGDIAKIENVFCSKELFYHFYNVLNGFNSNYFGNISINNIEMRRSNIVCQYIQRHSLFINDNFPFNENFSIKENLIFQSKFWSGKDLSREAILSLGLTDIMNKNASKLTKEEINILNLAKVIYCNSHIWFIPYEITNNIPNYNKEFLKNVFEIRVNQGGLIILFHY